MDGNSQANALTWTTRSGGKNPGAAGAGTFLQSSNALLKESLAPHADDLTAGVETGSDLVVREALGGKQNHFGADDLKIRQRIFVNPTPEFGFLLPGQSDLERARTWQLVYLRSHHAIREQFFSTVRIRDRIYGIAD